MNGVKFGTTTFYIVENTPKRDIICDVVVGRTAIGNSRFYSIDVRDGTLFDRVTNESIPLAPCTLVMGEMLVPIHTPLTQQAT